MVTYTYTGTLTDVVKSPITPSFPELTVRPEVEAFGPDGLVSEVRVPVALDPVTGAFSMTLIASGDLTDARTGVAGVSYIIAVGRYELGEDNKTIWNGTDSWKFTAVAGGGNVGGMQGGSVLAFWFPPWPEPPYPKGMYVDTVPPNEWTIVS